MVRPLKTKSAKQLKCDLLEAVQALGGKNKLIATIKQEMEEGNNTGWWNLINTCSKFVPKEINQESTITIQLAMPDIPRLEEKEEVIDIEGAIEYTPSSS